MGQSSSSSGAAESEGGPPPYFSPLLKRYSPHQGGTSPLPPGGEALSSGTHAPSFSTEVPVTAKQTLRPPASTRRLSPQTFGGPRVHSQPTHGVPAGVHPSESLREALPSPVSSSGVIKGEGTDVPQLAQQFHSFTLPGPPTGTKAQSPHRDPALRHSDFSKHEGNS